MSDFMPKPCKHCPFRVDVTPFLHPNRAVEIAYISENPYSEFPCHKTLEYEEDDEERGDHYSRDVAKACAGMLTMRANQLGEESLPDGFEPSWQECYSEPGEMIFAYEDEWEKTRGG